MEERTERPKKRGRGKQINIAERTAIQALALANISQTDIAQSLGRSRQAVARVLSGEEFRQAREAARSALAENAVGFAKDLIRASEIAAGKGKHEPALAGLMAIKAVEPAGRSQTDTGFTVKIGVLLPGLGDTAKLGIEAGDVVDAEFGNQREVDSGLSE